MSLDDTEIGREEYDYEAYLFDPNEEDGQGQEEGQALEKEDRDSRICIVCHEPFFETGHHTTCAKCRQRRHRARMRDRAMRLQTEEMKKLHQIMDQARADSLDRWTD